MASSSNHISASRSPRVYSREIVFLTTILLLVLMILVTAFLARMYHKKYHVLGDEWFAIGNASFRSGDAAAALGDYRNALLYNPGNPAFQFHLAQALAGTGRDDEARAYLTSLLSESPGSGEINLALARIAVRSGPKSMQDALRFYHAAIYGVWDTDPIGTRWQIRREFCEYLLNNHSMIQAEGEVIALADNTSPDNPAEQKIAANLLLRAQMWSRALQQFESLLAHDSHDDDSLAGAAICEFQLAQYSLALQYFDRLPRERRLQSDFAKPYETSRDVVISDPFLPGLSVNDKAERTANALTRAITNANACMQRTGALLLGNPPTSALQVALAKSNRMAPEWTERNLRKFPDRIDPAMSSVFELEDAAAQQCGELQGADYALWLLGRSRGVNAR
jgi:tetratricopeptide (TPR) repeat protein